LIKPIFDMYWDSPIFGGQVNWLPYIWITMGFLVCHRALLVNRMGLALIACASALMALQMFCGKQAEPAHVLRSLVSILPLVIVVASGSLPVHVAFDRPSSSIDDGWRRRLIGFLWIYSLCLLPNLIVLVEQMLGLVPVLDFDVIDGEELPRYSGAYRKPNNLAITLLPVFISALCFIRGEKGWGLLRAGSVLVAISIAIASVQLIGLRTFLSILMASIVIFSLSQRQFSRASRILSVAVVVYPLVLLGSFAVFGKFVDESLLRGRTDAWVGHLQDYLGWSILDQLLGKGQVSLIGDVDMGAFSEEFHNDFGRILITHGLLGLLIYIGIIRAFLRFASAVFRDNDVLLRANLAGIVGLLMYSTTNEPTYYPSVFWSFLIIPILMIGHARLNAQARIDFRPAGALRVNGTAVSGGG